jgi:hypothetical protein
MESLERLERLVDEMARLGQCAPDDAHLALCHLRLAHERLVETALALRERLAAFVAASSALFLECERAYRLLYVEMYVALDPMPISGRGANPAPDLQGVPIDPAGPLARLATADRAGELWVTLYNDNETLLQLPVSSLAERPGAAKTVERMGRHHAAHCEAIAAYEERAALLWAEGRRALEGAARDTRAAAVALRQQVFLGLLQPQSRSQDASRVAAFQEAVERVCEESRAREEGARLEEENARVYEANVRVKTLEVSRLYDTLLRGYWQTVTRRRTTRMASIF